MQCPACNSDHVRRGGPLIWIIDLALIAAGVIGVLIFRLHAGLVAGIMVAVVVLAHLTVRQWTCLDCGHQWRSG